MEWKPNKWAAAFLGLITPLGLLHVGRWRLALAYFAVAIGLALTEFILGGPGYSTSVLSLLCAVHSYRIASKALPVASRPWYGRWYGMLGLITGGAVLIAIPRAFLIEPFRMPSAAMAPTMDIGTTFLVSKLGYRHFGTYGFVLTRQPPIKQVRRGAVVVFESPSNPGQNFVKRVVGLPGDNLTYKNKILSVNGVAVTMGYESTDETRNVSLEELDGVEYRTMTLKSKPPTDWELPVPSSGYFLMGDNRDGSFDSRQFGAVSGDLLIGEVAYVIK